MAAPTCCLKHPCSSFVLNSTDCYKFYYRTLYKQIYWRSLTCKVSSTLNCVSCGSWAFYLQPQSIGSCTKIFIRDWNLSFTLSSLSIFNRWSQKESFCANFRSKIEKLFTINKWLIAANWGKLRFVPQVCNDRWSPISPLHSSVICTFANTVFLD